MSETHKPHETQLNKPRETEHIKLGNSTEVLKKAQKKRSLGNIFKRKGRNPEQNSVPQEVSPERVETTAEEVAEALTAELAADKTQIQNALNTAREVDPNIPENADEVVEEVVSTEKGREGFLKRMVSFLKTERGTKMVSFLKTERGTKVAGVTSGIGASLSLRLGARAVLGPNFWVAVLAGATAGAGVETTKEFLKDRKRYDGDEIEARLEEAVLGFEITNKIGEGQEDPTKTIIIEKGKELSALERAGIIAKAEEIIRSDRVKSENLTKLIGLVENARFQLNMETQKPEFKGKEGSAAEKKKVDFILRRRHEARGEKLERSEKKEVRLLLSEMESKFGKPEVSWKNVRGKKLAKAALRGAVVGGLTAAAASLFLDCLPSSWTHALSEKAQHVVEQLYSHATPEITAEIKQQIISQGEAHAQEVYAQILTNAKEQAVNQSYQATVESGHSITHAARDAVHDFYTNLQHLAPGALENIDQAHMVAIENELARAKVEELGSSIVNPGDVLEFKGSDILEAIQHAGNMSESQAQSLQHFLAGRLSEHSAELMLNHNELVKAGVNDYFTSAMQSGKEVYGTEKIKAIYELTFNEAARQAAQIEANEASTKYFTAFAVSAGIGYSAGMLVRSKNGSSAERSRSLGGGYSKEESEEQVPEKSPVIVPETPTPETAPTPVKKVHTGKEASENKATPDGEIDTELGDYSGYTKAEENTLYAFGRELRESGFFVGPRPNLKADLGMDEVYKKNMLDLYDAVRTLGMDNLKGLKDVVLIAPDDFNLAEDRDKGYTVFKNGKSIGISMGEKESIAEALAAGVEHARKVRQGGEQSKDSGDAYKERKANLEAKFGARLGFSHDFKNLIPEAAKRVKIMEEFYVTLEDYPAEKLAGKNVGNILVNPPDSLLDPVAKGRSPVSKSSDGRYTLYVKSPSLENPTKEGFVKILDGLVAELDSKVSLAAAEARVAAGKENPAKAPEKNVGDIKEALSAKFPNVEISGWENFSGSGKDFASFDVEVQKRIIAKLEEAIAGGLSSLGEEYIPGTSVYNENNKTKLDLTQSPLKIVKT